MHVILYTNFYVKRSFELVSEVDVQNLLGTLDHSLLVWDITLDMEYHESKRTSAEHSLQF